MILKQQAKKIGEALEKVYPLAQCELDYIKPYELLIATRLSAQCTDKRVNIVTKDLFAKYTTLKSFAEAAPVDVEKIIRPCGLGKTKSKDIVNMSVMLTEKYDGVLPNTVEELIKLPGVGRKTANLIVGDIYKKPAIVCDTHVIRICGLLGLTNSKNPLVVENELRKILEPKTSNDFCHRIVLHGRAVCIARKPKCDECVINMFCNYYKDVYKI